MTFEKDRGSGTTTAIEWLISDCGVVTDALPF